MTVAPPSALEPIAPPKRRVPGRGRFFLVCALLAAGVAVLLYKGLLSSLNYFDTVDQALANRAQIGTSSIRLEGLPERGTIDVTQTGASFSLTGGNGRFVTVVYTGSPPQLFQPEIPVVVVGHFATDTSTVFYSSEMMIKHTAQYIARNPSRVRAPNGSVR
jgi:cytochrome c-type biogenesis protein CcmE